MRRADRLFQIVQFLRSRRLTTAEWLADKLEVSKRTIYRDIADLCATGVPIEGEAGVGYVLRRKLDLPPLMFDRRELTALELGLRFVCTYAGPPLAAAAASAMSKVRSALPGDVARDAPLSALYVPKRNDAAVPALAPVLAAIDGRQKLRIGYADEAGNRTGRIIWPLGAFFWGTAWTVLSWCELREDFRSFRLERIERLEVMPERFPDRPGRRLSDYFRWIQETHSVPLSEFDPL